MNEVTGVTVVVNIVGYKEAMMLSDYVTDLSIVKEKHITMKFAL